jgi:hypothetical protein
VTVLCGGWGWFRRVERGGWLAVLVQGEAGGDWAKKESGDAGAGEGGVLE